MAKSGPPGVRPHKRTVQERIQAGWSADAARALAPRNRRQAASIGAKTSPWRHAPKEKR